MSFYDFVDDLVKITAGIIAIGIGLFLIINNANAENSMQASLHAIGILFLIIGIVGETAILYHTRSQIRELNKKIKKIEEYFGLDLN